MLSFITSLTWRRHSRLLEDPTDYKESQVQATSPNYKDESQVQTSPESPVASDLPPLINTTERKLMAKVDWHVVPILCVMYLLAFLDR